MGNFESSENLSYVFEFFKSVLLSIIISLILLFVLAFVISNTEVKESFIDPGVIFISSISILISSFLVSKKLKKKGIICGAIVGFCYMLIMYIFSSFMNMDFSLTINSLMMILFGILGGIIGGILGVNL